MNCIIIDDEATARSFLNKLCTKVKDLNVKKEFDNAKDALKFLENNKIDLIFLDLHMPVLSGFDFIEVLEQQPKIILTTTDRNSALKAFEYKCIVDYLGKPFKMPRFLLALDKVNRAIKISKEHEESLKDRYEASDLYININKKLVKFSLGAIEIIKTHPKGIEICTSKQSFVVKSSLSKIIDKLPKSKFIKVHQSYIININKIIDIKNGHILINHDSIPVSRMNKAELMSKINLF
ncbi:LytR/AlgR family response regulator transcription factor [Mariniflexile sp. AS56]|uniref:LytR/AlgR family response regulator transcription factor n=1 Tax=Mariniflexile sp. AS56 TaxID=3063957 RepID=UPI0026E9D6E1|nr:response regulator transcription factor [Mariniflexile sp. AS56]MDO7171532.1 response regulator transcription factor [Mariniflexile sp. AS56]